MTHRILKNVKKCNPRVCNPVGERESKAYYNLQETFIIILNSKPRSQRPLLENKQCNSFQWANCYIHSFNSANGFNGLSVNGDNNCIMYKCIITTNMLYFHPCCKPSMNREYTTAECRQKKPYRKTDRP